MLGPTKGVGALAFIFGICVFKKWLNSFFKICYVNLNIIVHDLETKNDKIGLMARKAEDGVKFSKECVKMLDNLRF